MNKLMMIVALFSLTTACASIDRSSVNGKDVVTATRAAPVIFTMMGAPTSACLADLDKAGVKEVNDVQGSNENAFILSRLSGVEACQATGSK